MKLTIPGNISISSVEELLAEFQKLPGDEKIDVTLPNELKEQTFAAIPSLIQFFGTLLREEQLFIVRSKNDVQTESEAIQNWYNEIVDTNDVSIKPIIFPINREINERIRNFKPLRHGFMTPCFDHLPKANGLLKMFYPPPSYELASRNMIEQYVNQIVSNLGLLTNKSVVGQLSNLLAPITDIVHELFMNTHDWATKDRFGDRIEYGVRGVYFRFYRNFKKQLAENAD